MTTDTGPSGYDSTGIHQAVIRQDFQQLLIELAHSPNDINRCDSYGCLPLIDAIKLKQWESVRVLLLNGAQVNVFDSTGESPLSVAWREKNATLVREILKIAKQNNIDVSSLLDDVNKSMILSPPISDSASEIIKCGLKDPYA